MEKFGFKTAFTKLPGDIQPVVKEKIMSALGVTTRDSWSRRMRGLTEPKVTEAAAVEQIFKEYGAVKVWDHEFES